MFDDEADVCQCEECRCSAEKATQQARELGSSADHDGTGLIDSITSAAGPVVPELDQ
jgi:hypothetical protein